MFGNVALCLGALGFNPNWKLRLTTRKKNEAQLEHTFPHISSSTSNFLSCKMPKYYGVGGNGNSGITLVKWPSTHTIYSKATLGGGKCSNTHSPLSSANHGRVQGHKPSPSPPPRLSLFSDKTLNIWWQPFHALALWPLASLMMPSINYLQNLVNRGGPVKFGGGMWPKRPILGHYKYPMGGAQTERQKSSHAKHTSACSAATRAASHPKDALGIDFNGLPPLVFCTLTCRTLTVPTSKKRGGH